MPDFHWSCASEQIIVPCAGRLQPEHVLRAFEKGSSIVSVVACQEDNCHYIEGSRRCSLRIDYIRSILDEIGLGEERLLLFHLPGSAFQDLAATAGQSIPAPSQDLLSGQIAGIRDQVMEVLRSCPPNPLYPGNTVEDQPLQASAGGRGR